MCRKALPTERKFFQNNPKLRIVYKEFLLFGKKSALPAYAALAANRQGKYLALHNAMLTATKPLTMSEILELANKCGLNLNKFKADMQDPKIHQQIKANTKLLYSLNIKGAPSYIFTKTALAKNPSLATKTKQLLYIGAIPEYALQKILGMAQQ